MLRYINAQFQCVSGVSTQGPYYERCNLEISLTQISINSISICSEQIRNPHVCVCVYGSYIRLFSFVSL